MTLRPGNKNNSSTLLTEGMSATSANICFQTCQESPEDGIQTKRKCIRKDTLMTNMIFMTENSRVNADLKQRRFL